MHRKTFDAVVPKLADMIKQRSTLRLAPTAAESWPDGVAGGGRYATRLAHEQDSH
jgi:hypothetical protein